MSRTPGQAPGSDSAGPDLNQVWDELRRTIDSPAVKWLEGSRPLTVHENMVFVAVPSQLIRERIETRIQAEVEQGLAAWFDQPMRLILSVDSKLEPEPSTFEPATELHIAPSADVARNEPWAEPDQAQPMAQIIDLQARSMELGQEHRSNLNPKYTFDSFVIGESNRFAHAAAGAVAEAPGKSYNPLMIYGESGLGKTHLLHAIGHYVQEMYPRLRVKYVSTEEFLNDFINAIGQGSDVKFRRTYREVDVLLVDDIQILESKIQTQEAFFHTFNTLHNAQKQIVLTSDRPPKALEALESRLRSRFEWGLITDIQPPDLETRLAILRRKATAENLSVDTEVLAFIAQRIATNIRELEGALIRVTAFASLHRRELDVEAAEQVLRDLIPDGAPPQVSSQLIIEQTADYFNITVDEVIGTSRTNLLVTARQIAMYLCRELTDLSLPKIGQEFGGKDHTTVMHADRKIRNQLQNRQSVFNQVTELTNRIKQAAQR